MWVHDALLGLAAGVRFQHSPVDVTDIRSREETMQTPQFLHPLDPLASPTTSPAAQAASPTGGAPPSVGTLNSFTMETQKQDEWCWAAVSVSVAAFYGNKKWSQCSLAAGEMSLNCCGADGPKQGTGGCNNAWYLDTPLTRAGHFARINWSSQAFADLQSEINAGRPLGARIAWNGGGAHFVALGGWSTDSAGTEFVDVYDPYYGFAQTSYGNFLSAYQSPGDSWTHSYFTTASMAPLAGSPSAAANSPKSA
jgi:hypothetical protein